MAEAQFINKPAADIPLNTDCLDAETLFAEDIRGVMVGNGIAKMNLLQYRADPTTGELSAIAVAHLVMPSAMLENWGNFFLKIAGESKADIANQAGAEPSASE